MDSKENPSCEPPEDSASLVEAILVPEQESSSELDNSADAQSSIVSAELVEETPARGIPPVEPVDDLLQANLAARGGAVASILLGILAIAGAAITPYSFINALLGLALGLWGMSSNVRWPMLGLILCLVGIFACVFAATGS